MDAVDEFIVYSVYSLYTIILLMPRKENLQPLLDVRQNHLGLVLGAGNSIDTTSLGMLGFSAAVFIFGLDTALDNPWWLWAPLIATLVGSIAAAVYAIWPRAYRGASVDLDQYPEYFSLDEEALLLQLIADTQESIHTNDAVNVKKMRACVISIVLALTGLALLLVCIM